MDKIQKVYLETRNKLNPGNVYKNMLILSKGAVPRINKNNSIRKTVK